MEDIKFVKLVSGDSILAKYDEEKNVLVDIVSVQAVPMGSGSLQLALLPFGFPFEEEIGGKIDMDKIMYEYEKVPEDLIKKYIEAKSNIKIAGAGDLGALGGGPKPGGDSGILL